MSESQAHRTIMVGVDHSALAQIALESAVVFADAVRATRLHLVRVLEPFPVEWPVPRLTAPNLAVNDLWGATLDAAKKDLDERVVPTGRLLVTREVRVGVPAQELVLAASQAGADVIVVASHDRHGLNRFALGSVASTLLRTAHCPVLVVSKDRPGTKILKRIFAAVDLSPVSGKVIEHAMSIAACERASLRVVSLLEPLKVPAGVKPEVRDELQVLLPKHHRDKLKMLIEKLRDPRVEVDLEIVSPAAVRETILKLAKTHDADLIAIGTSGHNAWHRLFLGSTATRVVSDAHCPVLVVPFDSPRVPHASDNPKQEERS
jgi:nucleotide-binding universal stress UspA family protein